MPVSILSMLIIGMSQTLPAIYLKRHEERRLRSGHIWIYSNEIDSHRSPLSQFESGTQAAVFASNDQFIGNAYLNPHSLICGRVFSRTPNQRLDQSLLVHRLNIALSLRERCYSEPYYRLVYGEGDFLPGLIIDRYADVIVVQLNTAGMDRIADEITAAIEKVLKPAVIVFRNDSSAREQEGLSKEASVVYGSLPETAILKENGAEFVFDPLQGQKTGWFFDHRNNRQRAQHFAKNLRVLDLFSYIGGWGIEAAVAGAKEVICVDASENALNFLEQSAERNQVRDKTTIIEGNVFDVLKILKEDKQQFDMVILDPPAFIKRKKDLRKGLEAYQRVNQQAMQLLGRDGLLVSASCSYHLAWDELRKGLHLGARHLDRQLQILEQGHLGADHPIHPALPESDYLKSYISRVVRA